MRNVIKNAFITICLGLLFGGSALAQDTIYCTNNKKIASKVEEIGLSDIKYRDFNNPLGPLITIRKSEVLKLRYENGIETVFQPDKYSVNQEQKILDKTHAVKAEFFAPLGGKIVLGYEQMLKIGTNLELKAGIIGPGIGIMANQSKGGFFKAGVKFLAGQEYVVEGMRYAHPLRGRYIKPEISFCSFREYDVYPYGTFTFNTGQSNVADARRNALALNIIFGKQFILGNLLTLDLYLGAGFGWANSKLIGDAGALPLVTNDDLDNRTNYYSHQYFGHSFPLSITSGMTLGFVF